MTDELANMRILAIDDQPDNLLLLRQGLRQMGYLHCDTETTTPQALARFYAEDYDLVLLDYNMPDMNGLELLTVIGEKVSRELIPVIIITAQTDREIKLATLQAGAKDFLNKPIDLCELQARVGNLLENRRLHRQQRQQNRILEEKIRQRTDALQSSRLELIRRLAYAAEFRDTETGTHVKRMSLYAHCIGRGLSLAESELDLLLNASPMHDIGKIGISDNILLKPGKYTPEEFAIMQAHTTIGAKILEGSESELIQAGHDIALYHHERWDGKGYPHGLSNTAIPLLARIVSVADVFDALTMVRPYKKAWSTTDAHDEIIALSGRFFDPMIVNTFTGCFDEILTIYAAYSD